METIELAYPIQQQPNVPLSLAIGFFDGVHLGHQAVIRQALRLADSLQAIPSILTFSPHPREVLGTNSIQQFITPLPEKLRQFSRLGIKRTYLMRFDQRLAMVEKESFVKEVLLPLGVKGVITGYNFTFGRNAKGNPSDLKQLGKGKFIASTVHPVFAEGIPSSSTNIRNALSAGRMETANQMLGRSYVLKGRVVTGDQRGRLIGFPTANLSLEDPYIIPRRGVYIVLARYDSHQSYGLMNIGIRPTFHDPEPREHLEVHLLIDQKIDLYEKTMEVEFLHYLREEQKFASVEELRRQIQLDKEKTQAWLHKKVNE